MSIANLYSNNDTVLYCGEMHCKKVVPPLPGSQGDIYTVNAANQSVFSKQIEGIGPSQPLQIKNMPLQILADNGLAPAILGVGSDVAHGMPAIIGMGNLATQDSFFFAYADDVKNLSLGQNNACVDHDFTTELNNGNLIVNNKLKLPTVTANNILKIDNSNVVTNATSTDFNNIYNNDGQLQGNRTVGLNGNALILGQQGIYSPALVYISDGSIGIKSDGGDTSIGNITQLTASMTAQNVTISAPGGLLTLSGAIQTPSLTSGFLQADGSGNLSTSNVAGNFISSYIQSVPGNYNVVVPASATNCTISAVGGGGGGCLNIGFASPGGGAAGSIVNYPTSVFAGQTIPITVGQGGAVNTDGTDTIIVLGTQTIICGKGLTSTDQTHGGNGGSVNLGFTTIAGGAGGAFQVNGSNGNFSYFVYTGAGGGGTRANGGNNILFVGGAADANYGGGGASGFANGANNHSNGSRGSGGGADNGSGGDGYVQINFYS